ncbi:MAG: bifunctional hydroxymethylpyrimidine kinase/phosphomethylpyrimidine kinase [Candidatus Bathyarchaeota archaeon]|nr:bifunctional hydroxymethylpyrimidine kinase/phosphomethylpyrimidine kinase [Candidatus Bathyarchaeota archaeon]
MPVKNRIPVAITIAGSDSGGGAGIQADLKTFAALGVHGTVAITSVTAQNTYSVRAVQDLKPEIISEQIRAVAEDFGIDAGKTGMLHTEEIIKAVASEVSRYNFPMVVDPVMVAKSGAPLLKPEAVNALKEHLLPLATVITPNKFEAERLSGLEIKSLRDAEAAAEKISKMGPDAVVIKGGHIEGVEVTDILYYKGRFWKFTSSRLDAKTTHGTGCSFSAAIAAGLAKKLDIPEAVENAKNFVTLSIRFGLNVGRGYGPVNPMAYLYREASRYEVLLNLEEAKNLLEGHPEVAELVPEVGMNVAMAVKYAESVNDVAAIDGRIVRTLNGVRAAGNPKFGCSRHLAKYLVEVVRHDEDKRAAINLKFSEKTLKILEERGLTVSSYDRAKEPEEIKRVEGMTIPWGVREAIKSVGKVPDVIYHRGDVGKEPMIVVLGKDAVSLAKLVVEIAGGKNSDL